MYLHFVAQPSHHLWHRDEDIAGLSFLIPPLSPSFILVHEEKLHKTIHASFLEKRPSLLSVLIGLWSSTG